MKAILELYLIVGVIVGLATYVGMKLVEYER